MKLYQHTDENGKEYAIRSPFWKFLREYQPLASEKGYRVTDLDGQIWSLTGGSFLVIEHKCRNTFPAKWQNQILHLNDMMYSAAAPSGAYRGTYLIQHSGESPTDGETTISRMIDGDWQQVIIYPSGDGVFQFIKKSLEEK